MPAAGENTDGGNGGRPDNSEQHPGEQLADRAWNAIKHEFDSAPVRFTLICHRPYGNLVVRTHYTTKVL
jgi:hypothetical protein